MLRGDDGKLHVLYADKLSSGVPRRAARPTGVSESRR